MEVCVREGKGAHAAFMFATTDDNRTARPGAVGNDNCRCN